MLPTEEIIAGAGLVFQDSLRLQCFVYISVEHFRLDESVATRQIYLNHKLDFFDSYKYTKL